MRSVSSSGALPVALPSVKLALTALEVLITWGPFFFSTISISNARSGCWEERFYLPEGWAPGRWRLKAHFTCCFPCAALSTARDLRSSGQASTRQGSQTPFCSASFSCQSFCNALAGLIALPKLEVRQREFRNHHPKPDWRLPAPESHNQPSSPHLTQPSLPKQISSIAVEYTKLAWP